MCTMSSARRNSEDKDAKALQWRCGRTNFRVGTETLTSEVNDDDADMVEDP
jgi:hypothetical protein